MVDIIKDDDIINVASQLPFPTRIEFLEEFGEKAYPNKFSPCRTEKGDYTGLSKQQLENEGIRRQGRSHESRLRVSENSLYWRNCLPQPPTCTECNGVCFVVDSKTRDRVCIECGLIAPNGDDAVVGIPGYHDRVRCSKPYSNAVYFGEKLAQFNDHDPLIYEDEMDLIKRKLVEEAENGQDVQHFGKRRISAVCKSVGLGHKKYGERFIQIRIRCGLELNFQPMPVSLRRSLKERAKIYEHCWNTHFKNKKEKKSSINLNYLIAQFIRLEDDINKTNYWTETWSKYIHVTDDKKKLNTYNQKWKTIVQYLQRFYKSFEDPITERDISKIWYYKTLTLYDLFHKDKLY
jgi:hypothetical protein